jgi:hypothetical protein
VTVRRGLWNDRHGFGAAASQIRAPEWGIVAAEGGGLLPTLFSGGGADDSGAAAASMRARAGLAPNSPGGCS